MKHETPVIEYDGCVLNGNRVFFKLECNHPIGGSHYGRVYGKLFADAIARGDLRPGMRALETSTGSAGISFAMMGRLLGYPCIVAVPKGLEGARIKAIKAEGAEVILVDSDYVNGFPEFLAKYRDENPDVCFLNHSMNEKAGENKITTAALEAIAHELLDEPRLPRVDYFLAAVGNGSSLLGPARVFRACSPETKIVAYEPLQSGVAYERHKPGQYNKEYGIEIGTLPRHRIFGTSYPGIPFPHIRLAFRERLVDETWLVSDKETDEYYRRLTGSDALLKSLPRWNQFDTSGFSYGRSTACGLAVALKIAERERHGDKVIVVMAYDRKENRYGC